MNRNIHRIIQGLCVLAFLLTGTARSWAWSAGGHKVVALIALSQLDAETRAKVVTLLKEHPRWKKDFAEVMPAEIVTGTESDRQRWVFAQAGVWPDMARDLPEFHHSTWHYINEPLFLNAQDADALTGHLAVNLEYVWTPQTDDDLQNAPQTVDMAMKTLRDPDAKPADKALMLCWLMHVVGDLHQPLHTVALFSKRLFRQGDRGGNSIEFHPVGAEPKSISLHAFWDHLLKTDVSLNEASAEAQSILAEPGMPAKAAAAGSNVDPKVWVAEGKKAALGGCYNETILKAVAKADADPGFNFKKVFVKVTPAEVADYGKKAGPIASERAAIGGYRLADLLRQALK